LYILTTNDAYCFKIEEIVGFVFAIVFVQNELI